MILGHSSVDVTQGIYTEGFDSSRDTVLILMNIISRLGPARHPFADCSHARACAGYVVARSKK